MTENQTRCCRKWTGPRAEKLCTQYWCICGLCTCRMSHCQLVKKKKFVSIIEYRTCSTHDLKKKQNPSLTRVLSHLFPPSSAHVQLSTSVSTATSGQRTFSQENNSAATRSSARNPSMMRMGRQRSASTQLGSRTQSRKPQSGRNDSALRSEFEHHVRISQAEAKVYALHGSYA